MTAGADCWRTGRKVGRTIYRQLGPHPSDSDPLVGVMDTAEDATRVVAAVNDLAALTIERDAWRTGCETAVRERDEARAALAELRAVAGALCDAIRFEASADPETARRRAEWQWPMGEARDRVRALLEPARRPEGPHNPR